MERSRSWAAVLAAVLAAAGAARAGVEAETGGNLKAKGTLAPSGETESFSFAAVEGTVLSVKAKGKSGLVPSLALFGDGGVPVDPGPGVLVVSGSSAQVRKFPLPHTAEWRLDLSGEGTGEYSLTLKTKAPRSASGTLTLDPAATDTFPFAAPAGSTLKIVVKADKGSPAVPRLGLLSAEGGDPVDLSAMGTAGAASHAAVTTVPGDGGDLTLQVSNNAEGGSAGAVLVSVKIKAPKAPRDKLDLRGAALGMPAGGETFLSKTLDSGGGTLAAGAGGLQGASLVVPEGALGAPVRITLASAPSPAPPTKDDQAAGPAVDLRPSGLLFDSPATLTLPFDPASLPGNAAPGDIRVLVVEGDGTAFEIVPTSTDAENGTVTLPLGGFSVCIPVVRSGVPRLGVAPGGDEYWNLTLEYELTPPETGSDSRARYFLQEVGETSFYGDGTVQTSSSWRTFSYRNDPTPGGYDAGIEAFEFPQEYAATWQYGADGRTIEIQEGDGGPVLAASRDGSVLLEHEEDPGDRGVGWILLLRKNAAPLDDASLKGTWFFGGVEVGVNQAGFDGPATLDIQREFGTVTFDGAGTAKFAASEREAERDGGTGALSESSGSFQGTATYAVQEDGTILLTVPPDDGDDQADVLRFYPGRNADIMFLADDGPCGGCTYAAILVRQGSGLSPAALDGDYLGSTLSVDLGSYAPAPGNGGPATFVGDGILSVLDFEATFDGDTSASLDGSEHSVRRDEGGEQGILSQTDSFSTPLGVAVDAKGKLTLTPQGEGPLLLGAVSSDGMFAFLVTNPALSGTDFLLGIAVRAPPETVP